MTLEVTEKALTDHADAVTQKLNAMQTKYDKLDSALTEFAQKSETAGDHDGSTGPDKRHKNPLAALGASVEVKAFASDRSLKSANVPLAGSLVAIKSVVGDVTGAGNQLFNVQAQRDPRLAGFAARRLSIFDVLPRLQAISNTFEYNQLDGYTSAAANQSKEGASKAQGTLPTELVSAPIVTIAHFFKLSEQVLADAPALQQQVGNLLNYGVLAKASAEILAGSVAGKIQGLATQATAYVSAAGATLADAIGGAMTALDVAGWIPDVAVMHPTDWFRIRSERTATDKDYVANGWAGPAEQTVWGLRVVTDPAIAIGSPLVLDSSQVAILDREQTRVEFGRSGTDMTDNLITALGECRVGLAVFAPAAVLEVTLTP